MHYGSTGSHLLNTWGYHWKLWRLGILRRTLCFGIANRLFHSDQGMCAALLIAWSLVGLLQNPTCAGDGVEGRPPHRGLSEWYRITTRLGHS